MKQTLKYIYSIVYDNLKFAESKHTLILTFSGAVLAFATTFFSENIAQNLFAIASIVFALLAIFYSFIALVAKTSKITNTHKAKVCNLTFYKDIMNFDEVSYINEIKKQYEFTNIYKPDNFDYDLARQIISNSKLAHTKFLYFNFAVVFLLASVLSLIVTVLIRGGVW